MLCCRLCSRFRAVIYGLRIDNTCSCTDMYRKDLLEHGIDDDGVLALRMLWASVSASKRWQSYSIFLEAMPPQLRSNISSVVVLRFWGAAAGIPPGVIWLAVFEVDEVRQRQLISLQAHSLLAVKSRAARSHVSCFCR
jgi:hypothetical protein